MEYKRNDGYNVMTFCNESDNPMISPYYNIRCKQNPETKTTRKVVVKINCVNVSGNICLKNGGICHHLFKFEKMKHVK